jgi:4-carboxymuconolactone decarboxylase
MRTRQTTRPASFAGEARPIGLAYPLDRRNLRDQQDGLANQSGSTPGRTLPAATIDSAVSLLQDGAELTRGRKPDMPETPTFGRYAEIPYDRMTPEQQEGYRSLLEARGRLPGPNKIYVHNPKLVKVMGPLGAYFRTGYSLSEREREIAVIIVNSKWHSAYPTNAHERAGKAAGLPAEKVEAMLSGLPTSFDDKREQVIYEMAKCLTESRWVSKGLYDRAVDALGHEGITDVICLMGFYTSVSMTLAFYDVPAGAEGLAR